MTKSAHVKSLQKNGNACLYFSDDYCILEFIADGGRFYRYDGKGDISSSEIEAYDTGREFENGYNGQ